MNSEVIAVGTRCGDVTIEGPERSDGRYPCKCDQGHQLLYNASTLKRRQLLCFQCNPAILKNNLSGTTIGRITLVRPVGHDENELGIVWQARCACEREFRITAAELQSFSTAPGGIFSCGCLPYAECAHPYIGGRVYEKLTVLRRNPKFTTTPYSSWLCRCECGRQVVRNKMTLQKGFTQNCGGYTCKKRNYPVAQQPQQPDPEFKDRIAAAFLTICRQNDEELQRHLASAGIKKAPVRELADWGRVAHQIQKPEAPKYVNRAALKRMLLRAI